MPLDNMEQSREGDGVASRRYFSKDQPTLPERNTFHGNRLPVVRLDIAQWTASPQGGGSGTAPKGTREGPDSLFTVDRREPFTQEPVGAPDRGAQLAIAANGAMWCITRQPALEGGTRATGDAREPTRRGGSR
jgi:hypothetical protein